MEYIVGVALALFVCGAAWLLGMDRDRVFYPTVLIVVASYYVLFAAMDGSHGVLRAEIAIAAVFAALPWSGSSATCGWWSARLPGMGCWTSSTMPSCRTPVCQAAGRGSVWPLT